MTTNTQSGDNARIVLQASGERAADVARQFNALVDESAALAAVAAPPVTPPPGWEAARDAMGGQS